MLYFETMQGNIVSDRDVLSAINLVNGPTITPMSDDEIRSYAASCRGIKCEVDVPDVEQLVRDGHKFKAIKVYYETHRCSLTEAREHVEAIEERIGHQD